MLLAIPAGIMLLTNTFLTVALIKVAIATSTSMYTFTINDYVNFNYPEGSLEYHCFESSGGNKTYVRGTYGYFGYFEGAVDSSNPLTFFVDWWDTSSTATGLLPNGGSAVITYNSAFTSMEGTYWNAGTSDVLNSFDSWSAKNGILTTDDSTTAGQNMILQKCLYAGAALAAPRDSVAALTNTKAISGKSEQGTTVFCMMPAGPAVGPWLGTYYFVYGDDDGGTTEDGNHGTDGITFWGASGMGLTGSWSASTGVYAGDVGTHVYMVTASTTTTYIVGFYCNIDENFVRTDCATELYTVSGVNENMQSCPSYYKKDGSLDDLYKFSTVGSNLSNQSTSNVSNVLAIFFGCLSGVLMLVIAYWGPVKRDFRLLVQTDSAQAKLLSERNDVKIEL